MTGQQITGLVIAALAVVAVVLLATLADGQYVTELLFFLGGLVLPAPWKGGGSGKGGRTGRRTGVIGAALVALMLVGCGATPYGVARTTLTASARILARADREFAEQRVERAQDIAADATSTRDEYRAAMAPFDEILLASMDVRDGMLAAQSSIDAAERGENSEWMMMLGCAALAASQFITIADRRGLQLPPDIRPLAETLIGLGATACSRGGGAQ